MRIKPVFYIEYIEEINCRSHDEIEVSSVKIPTIEKKIINMKDGSNKRLLPQKKLK